MPPDRKRYFAGIGRAVIKVGSNVLTTANGLNVAAIEAISTQICRLAERKVEVILVSSGAMAAGMRKVGLSRRPDQIPQRQAVAAVGQAGLILTYEIAFERHARKVAQMLLTSEDLCNRKRYLNARNTLNTLLSWQVLPIINENDTVAVEEIKFGDNDNLAAMITLLMGAHILVILSDIEGLYTGDPRHTPDARLIPEVAAINRQIEKRASDIPGALGTGGMLSKIKAARKVTAAGIPMVIAQGLQSDVLDRLFAGEAQGTFFVPQSDKLSSRKRWIAFAQKPRGTISIDAGAAHAILAKGKSLLPSGIVGVKGDFGVGAPVEFKDNANCLLGIGLVNYTAADIRKIMGLRSQQIEGCLGQKTYDEIIHRDNLIVIANPDCAV